MKQKAVIISLISMILALTEAFASYISPLTKHCMAAQTWEEEDWPNEPFCEFLDRCMRYQRDLQTFKKCKSTWGILDRCFQNDLSDRSFVLNNDWATWENLQLFKSIHEETPESYLVHKIDRTKLAIGRRVLETWIAHPKEKTSIDEIKIRQKIVQSVLEDSDLFEEIEKQISVLSNCENLFLSFWLNDPLYNTCSKSYFHTYSNSMDETLNQSSAALNCTSLWSHAKRITQCVSAVCGVGALAKQALLWDSIGEKSAIAYLGTAGPLFSMSKNYLGEWIDNSYFWKAFYLSAAIYSVKVAKESYDWAKDNVLLQRYAQEKLFHVASFSRAVQKIEEIFLNHPSLSDPILSTIVKSITEMREESKGLLHLINSASFEKTPNIFASPGSVLKAYREMHENRSSFEKVLLALGRLDAIMSIARLYREFENEKVRYCFVQFDETADFPSILFEDLWNPLIDKDVAIANPVFMGTQGNPRNIVLTGPNEGGKSSYAKAIGMALILSQSLGIAPSNNAVITPFDFIGTYLNITDDDGKSLFEAQVKRAKELLDQVDSLEQTQFAFLLLDEMFNGTNAKMGESLTYNYAQYLGNKPNVVSIFPTHFPFLTTLSKENSFANYCVTATFDLENQVKYLYKIVPGIWTQNIAIDILRKEGFPETFLQNIDSHF